MEVNNRNWVKYISNGNTYFPKYSQGQDTKCVQNQAHSYNLTCRWCTRVTPIFQKLSKQKRKEKNISAQYNGNITQSSGGLSVCKVVHRCSFGLRSEASCIKLPVVSIVIVCLLTKIYKALHKALMPSIAFICIGLYARPWTPGFTPALPLKQP